MKAILNSTELGRGESVVRATLHSDGRVIFHAGNEASSATIHILPVQMPKLIAFLQASTAEQRRQAPDAAPFTADRLLDLRNEIVRFQWQADADALDATHAMLAAVEEQWKRAYNAERTPAESAEVTR